MLLYGSGFLLGYELAQSSGLTSTILHRKDQQSGLVKKKKKKVTTAYWGIASVSRTTCKENLLVVLNIFMLDEMIHLFPHSLFQHALKTLLKRLSNLQNEQNFGKLKCLEPFK